MLSTQDLEALLSELRARGGDSTLVEVKSGHGGVPGLGETLCAFANLPSGGTIIVGVEENRDFTPCGVKNIAKLEQSIAAQARDWVTPPPQVEFQTLPLPGQNQVLIAQVNGLPLASRPAKYKGVAYLRQADGDYPLSEQELAHIEMLKTQGFSRILPDRQAVTGWKAENLDLQLMNSYLATLGNTSRRFAAMTDDEILVNSGVVSPATGELTWAGLYAMGVAPQSASPSLGVTAAVQVPASQRDFSRGASPRTLDLCHFTGPIPDLLEQSLAWVERNTRSALVYDEHGNARDQPQFPLAAAREIIANALVHRDLSPITDSKRVEIRIRADVLSVTSPGGLWGVNAESLGMPGSKSAVNPLLYEICKHVTMPDGSRIIEGEGGGIRETIEVLRHAGLPEPRFIDRGISFTALLFLSPTKTRVERFASHLSPPVKSEPLTLQPNESPLTPQKRIPPNLFSPNASVMESTDVPDSQSVKEASPPENSALKPASPVQRPTKNGAAIIATLTQPRTFNEILELTGLNTGQARYALKKLLATGTVKMLGSQGVRTTTYTLN